MGPKRTHRIALLTVLATSALTGSCAGGPSGFPEVGGWTQAGEVRIYTAGGSNLACNYVYSAAPDRFDASIGSVEDMLKSMTIEFLGPMFSLD